MHLQHNSQRKSGENGLVGVGSRRTTSAAEQRLAKVGRGVEFGVCAVVACQHVKFVGCGGKAVYNGSGGHRHCFCFPGAVIGVVGMRYRICTSGLASYTLPLASGEQALMVGGTTANGSVSQAAWAFDGTNFCQLMPKSDEV